MKNFITLVISLLMLVSFTQKAIAQGIWPTGGNDSTTAIDVFLYPTWSELNICYNGQGVWLKAGPNDDGIWYDWSFPSGAKSDYIVYYDPMVEGDFYYCIGCLRGDGGNIAFCLNFHLPDTSSQNATICDGEVYWAEGTWQSTSGTYVDTLSNINGCDSIVTTVLTVTPLTTLDLGPDSVEVQTGQSEILYATVSDPCTFVWSTGETTQSIVVDTSGWYYVTATSSCGDLIDSVYVDVLTTVKHSISNTPSVQVCPNPASNFINISGLTSDIKKIEVWSMDGKCIITPLTDDTSIIIDVSMLYKGIYIIKIGLNTRKLIKL